MCVSIEAESTAFWQYILTSSNSLAVLHLSDLIKQLLLMTDCWWEIYNFSCIVALILLNAVDFISLTVTFTWQKFIVYWQAGPIIICECLHCFAVMHGECGVCLSFAVEHMSNYLAVRIALDVQRAATSNAGVQLSLFAGSCSTCLVLIKS